MNHYLPIFCLQHFAESSVDTGVTQTDAGSDPSGEETAPDAGVQQDRRETFQRLIREEYKDLFDETMQDIIQKRLRSVRQAPASPQPDPEGADRLYRSWMDQAEAVRRYYPGFDLQAEMADPRFRQLLRSRVDMRTAYEVLHQGELIPAAMAYAARAVEQRLAGSIASGSARPGENGSASQGAATTRTDVARMTRQQRQDIIQRVQRGEKITF